MKKFIDYAKTHKLTVFLILVIVFLSFKQNSIVRPLIFNGISAPSYKSSSGSTSMQFGEAMPSVGVSNMTYEYTPTPMADTINRKVVTDSNFSLLVKDVSNTIDQIRTKAASVAGYIIDVNIYRGASSESANLTLRVPASSVDDVSKYLRSISVKVVSENIFGKDITDQYEDVAGRLVELEKVKTKLETIMDSAATSDEMLRVFRQINEINAQIDSYKGKMEYMDDASITSKLTVALSTDELSLPYSPAEPWRPDVVFKSAVRSLLSTLQSLGTALIWLVVYLPAVGLATLGYLIIKKLWTRKTATSKIV